MTEQKPKQINKETYDLLNCIQSIERGEDGTINVIGFQDFEKKLNTLIKIKEDAIAKPPAFVHLEDQKTGVVISMQDPNLSSLTLQSMAEKSYNKILKNKPNRTREACVIENDLIGVRLNLVSEVQPVSELQNQALETIQKIIKTTPTKIPLGVG